MQCYQSLFTSSYVSNFDSMEMSMDHINWSGILVFVFPGICCCDGIWKVFCIVKCYECRFFGNFLLDAHRFLFLWRLRSNLTFVVICLRILYVYDFSVFFFWVEYLGICFWVSHGILSLVFICISRVRCLSPDLQLISSLFSWSSMKYYSIVLVNFLESKLGRF